MFIGKIYIVVKEIRGNAPFLFLDQKEISWEVPNVTKNLNGSFMRADAPELFPGTLKNFVIQRKKNCIQIQTKNKRKKERK